MKKARAQKDKAVEEGRGSDKDTPEEASAKEYRRFVLTERKSARIAATLTEARPGLSGDILDCDSDPYLLNCPDFTYDLRTGKRRDHDPKDYITKCTSVSPCDDSEQAEIWYKHLQMVTGGDAELMAYLKIVFGSCLIGRVTDERLTIIAGPAGSGKSTTVNAILKTLGDYGSTLNAEIFAQDDRRNWLPELATLKGRRLVVAAELADNRVLDNAALKRLCSTDRVRAEPKYSQPFDFEPSHHVVMFCNELPSVRSLGKDVWDRLLVVPFRQRIRYTDGAQLNYADALFKACGGAVLRWAIDGAKIYIDCGGKVKLPSVVKAEIERYQASNDWLSQFISACCDTGANFTEGAASLYAAFASHCDGSGMFKHNQRTFSKALNDAGYDSKRTKTGVVYIGLQLRKLY